jgi:hypothetical protein
MPIWRGAATCENPAATFWLEQKTPVKISGKVKNGSFEQCKS